MFYFLFKFLARLFPSSIKAIAMAMEGEELISDQEKVWSNHIKAHSHSLLIYYNNKYVLVIETDNFSINTFRPPLSKPIIDLQ